MLTAVKDKPFGAAAWRPSLTAVRHGSSVRARSGQKNGFAEVELKNEDFMAMQFHRAGYAWIVGQQLQVSDA